MGMMVLRKLEKLARRCFEGDLTMPKVNFWLVAAVCLLAGMVYGMCIAPLTHGICIGSNNGNQKNCKWCIPQKDETPDEEA